MNLQETLTFLKSCHPEIKHLVVRDSRAIAVVDKILDSRKDCIYVLVGKDRILLVRDNARIEYTEFPVSVDVLVKDVQYLASRVSILDKVKVFQESIVGLTVDEKTQKALDFMFLQDEKDLLYAVYSLSELDMDTLRPTQVLRWLIQ